MVAAAFVGEPRLGVEEGESAVHVDRARLVVRARDAIVDAAVLQIGIGAEGVRQPVGGLQKRVVIELLTPAAVILIVGPRHSLDGLHPDDAPEVIARVVVDRGAPDGLQSVVGVGQAGQRAVEVVLEPLAPHQVGTLLLLAIGAREVGQLVGCVLGSGLIIFVIPSAVRVVQRHVQVEGVREALRGQKMVMMLPVVVRLVVVELFFVALLILAAAVVSAIGAQAGRVDAVPRLIAHLAAAEGLELEHRAAVVVGRRSVIRTHVCPRTLDVAVRLHVRVTGVEDKMVADESRSAAHGVRKGAETTRRRRGLEVWL